MITTKDNYELELRKEIKENKLSRGVEDMIIHHYKHTFPTTFDYQNQEKLSPPELEEKRRLYSRNKALEEITKQTRD